MTSGPSTQVRTCGSSLPTRAAWILAGLGLGPNAWAEVSTPEPPQRLALIQPLDRFEAEQERLQQQLKRQLPAYLDKVMIDGALEPAEAQPDLDPESVTSSPRSG